MRWKILCRSKPAVSPTLPAPSKSKTWLCQVRPVGACWCGEGERPDWCFACVQRRGCVTVSAAWTLLRVGSGRQEGGLPEERRLDLLMQREDSKLVGVTEEDAVERVRWRHLIGCSHTNNYIMYPQHGLLNPKLSTNCSWPQAKTRMYALFGECHEGRILLCL